MFEVLKSRYIVDLRQSLTTEPVTALRAGAPLCVTRSTSLRECLRLLRQHEGGSAFVCEDGKLCGLLTERDVLKLLVARVNLDAPVSNYMVDEPFSVRENTTIASAIEEMTTRGFRRLPVVDATGKVRGKVNAPSVLRFVVEHFPASIYNLAPANPTAPARDGA